MAEQSEPRPRVWNTRPFRARIIGGGPGSPPVIEIVIELAAREHRSKNSSMRLRIPFREAERLEAQLAVAIEDAHRRGLVPADMPE